MKIILPVIIMTLLTACQSQNTLIQSEGSYFHISPDATITITQELSVPANSARAYFQNGELLSHTGINLYNTSCEILINTVSESKQIIASGIFNVIAITQNESPIVMRKMLQVASLDFDFQQYAKAGGSSSPVDIHRYYQFKLLAQDPAKQKTQVRSLRCRGAQDTPYNASLPTFDEMQATLGPYVKLDLGLRGI